jgi:recombination DNA repair RAD52 pathway protein
MNKDNEIFEKLSRPFTIIGADGKVYPAHKWRVQSTPGGAANCVAYIDARQVSARLNEVFGVAGWSNTLIETGTSGMICEISVFIEGRQITKSNVGTETKVEGKKGQASDAFKRAAVHFGIGAYLHDFAPVVLKMAKHTDGKAYPATDNGQVLVNGAALTSYINTKSQYRQKLFEIYNALPESARKAKGAWFKEISELL